MSSLVKKIAEWQKEEDEYKQKLIESNMKQDKFEQKSISQLIIERLTLLACNNMNGERYTDTIPNNVESQYIKDLEILYQIKDKLQSSNKS